MAFPVDLPELWIFLKMHILYGFVRLCLSAIFFLMKTCWESQAGKSEILDLFLKCKFFSNDNEVSSTLWLPITLKVKSLRSFPNKGNLYNACTQEFSSKHINCPSVHLLTQLYHWGHHRPSSAWHYNGWFHPCWYQDACRCLPWISHQPRWRSLLSVLMPKGYTCWGWMAFWLHYIPTMINHYAIIYHYHSHYMLSIMHMFLHDY